MGGAALLQSLYEITPLNLSSGEPVKMRRRVKEFPHNARYLKCLKFKQVNLKTHNKGQ